jgi:glycosyltransferase involved in cell wall biosynthesis
MQTLIVATNATPPSVTQAIRADEHQRIDYIELTHWLRAAYIDTAEARDHPFMRPVENTLRLNLRQALHVAHAVRKQRFGIVLSLSERVGIPLSHMLDRTVRHVVIGHHLLSPHKLRLLKALRIPDRWDTIVVLTQAEADALMERLRLGADRIRVMNPPIDTGFFQPSEGENPATQPEHILSVGLSCRDYPTLIAAMRKIPQVTAHIRAGSTWVNNAAGYEHETIPDTVHIEPAVSSNLLRDCYAASRFVVIPIRKTTQWNVGATAVLEAQAMGKAVIVTRTPGSVDYVRDGETGMLVESGDAAGMAEAIDYLWRNPDQAAAMGQRGRQWIADKFSLDQWLVDTSNLLNGLDTSVTTMSANNESRETPHAPSRIRVGTRCKATRLLSRQICLGD